MKSMHKRKMIAPIVICMIFFLYYVAIAVACVIIGINESNCIGLLFAIIIPAVLAAVILYVTKERIDEIKGGEEDDLSKY